MPQYSILGLKNIISLKQFKVHDSDLLQRKLLGLAVRPKKNMCVSGFPTLPSFWHPKRPTLNFFLIDLPDLEGNQAILLKKRSEKLFSRICLSKLCPVNSKSSLALPETTESRFVWSAEMLTTHWNTSSTQAYE